MQQPRKPARRFYCYPADQVEGPFQIVELAGLLRSNHITAETLTLLEGEEQWLPFQERPEYHLANELPQEAVTRHVQETSEAQESSFSPRKLMTMAGIMAPLFLYVLYRFVRMYLIYHLFHNAAPADDALNPPGGS